MGSSLGSSSEASQEVNSNVTGTTRIYNRLNKQENSKKVVSKPEKLMYNPMISGVMFRPNGDQVMPE